MRRYLIVLFAACVLAAVVFPASASATRWVVKNAAGHRLGTVARTASRACEVYDRAGHSCGAISWSSDEYLYYAAYFYPDDYGVRNLARVARITRYTWTMTNENEDQRSGYIEKVGTLWQVKSDIDLRVRAKVSGSCPGWCAAGAGFILSKAFH